MQPLVSMSDVDSDENVLDETLFRMAGRLAELVRQVDRLESELHRALGDLDAARFEVYR